jgi:Mrp family chromosome partitioning ATPase
VKLIHSSLAQHLQLITFCGVNIINGNIVVRANLVGNKADIILDFTNKITTADAIILLQQKIRQCLKELANINECEIAICGDKIDLNEVKNYSQKTQHVDMQGLFLKPAKVQNIIMIGSGKGGVGKSTITANIAVEMAKQGLKVGVADLDICGSSIASIFGCENIKHLVKDAKIQPILQHNVAFVSMLGLIESQVPLMWRGAMLTKAITQIVRNTAWGDLDYLLLDTPPGTSDVHISLFYKVPIDGVVVIDSNDKLANNGAIKLMQMMAKFEIPYVTSVFNMCETASNNLVISYSSDLKKSVDNGVPFAVNSNIFAPIVQVIDEFLVAKK